MGPDPRRTKGARRRPRKPRGVPLGYAIAVRWLDGPRRACAHDGDRTHDTAGLLRQVADGGIQLWNDDRPGDCRGARHHSERHADEILRSDRLFQPAAWTKRLLAWRDAG